jgi:DNA invertase Pin-like site-specific DNA recombinase
VLPAFNAVRLMTSGAFAHHSGVRSLRTSEARKVREMKAQGRGASEIAKALKIGRASVYRVLDAAS